jgi:hypothetical protein
MSPFGYTIYRNPSDSPGTYVLRGWEIMSGVVVYGPGVAMPETDEALEALRRTMELEGRICLARSPSDDPVIVESWI